MWESLQGVLQDFMVTLATGVLALLSGFLVALAKKGFDWLSAKIETIKKDSTRKQLDEALDDLHMIVNTTVVALQQTLGDDIKESIKNNDGKYTYEDLLALKDKAVETVKSQLTEASREILALATDNLDAFIADLVEAAVRGLKTSDSSKASTTKLLME